MSKLIVILPCFNESSIIKYSIDKLSNLMVEMINNNLISEDSFLCFVDDGSRDDTWEIIKQFSKTDKLIKGIKLSNNFGHQNALLAGLMSNINKADIFITIDSDLQDDIEVIPDMIKSYKLGNEIVYGVRKSRNTDSFFKRKSAEFFYDLQNLIGINIIKNHADFRLISNSILLELDKFREINLYLRAIFPLIGYRSDIVYYERKARLAGETKYPLRKMLSFAWDGITSFTVFPLRLITILGTIIFLLSIIMIIWVLYLKLFTAQTIPGWSSTTIPIYFLGGIQLLSLGIIGEYIGKIYKEVKSRPRYMIEELTDIDKKTVDYDN
ncbi:glycosyltransferase family 2 protein [Sulfurovum sp. bin170]|uniref:glycosyltransferase family 2 protein n=1 Tax=Sulfurovum sp. bin170 TaxID=2695268 RepID=UPI0013E03054|nr:glycosyltransferase family 2 protein [Sulfurovum sp. bin170]NEW60325.1 glycosyltransferase family 2 protein [Sulfurovum sp. bin170]